MIFLSCRFFAPIKINYTWKHVIIMKIGKHFQRWVGYNISGGKKLEYTITPMVGGVVGLTDGLAPGLEFTFTYGRFELYNEMEYVFDVESK